MIELVIFDCDGVLVDSEPIALRFEANRIARYGWRITPAEIVELFVGRSDSFVREEVARRTGRTLGPEWDAAVQAEFWPALERGLEPVDGIVAALAAIDDRGVRSCVASSGTHDKMRFTLGRTGLWDRFEGRVFSASEVARGKPAPDLFLHAAARMQTEPTRCAVVEDSAAGVSAAVDAGMRVFAYAGGVTPRSKLERPGVTSFDDMRELPALLASAHARS
jgi:HAD superfamily hydrolase (TIGR01509 family)